jgi:hypothetical protein
LRIRSIFVQALRREHLLDDGVNAPRVGFEIRYEAGLLWRIDARGENRDRLTQFMRGVSGKTLLRDASSSRATIYAFQEEARSAGVQAIFGKTQAWLFSIGGRATPNVHKSRSE